VVIAAGADFCQHDAYAVAWTMAELAGWAFGAAYSREDGCAVQQRVQQPAQILGCLWLFVQSSEIAFTCRESTYSHSRAQARARVRLPVAVSPEGQLDRR
jgi:hypothetical protein